MKPKLLDLFCGAGGAAMGYARAGFEVVGVDIHAQPRYPFKFVQDDAIAVLERITKFGTYFDAIHASPPCQGYSTLAAMHPGREYPLLIEPVRELLERVGIPYVIENVEPAPVARRLQLDGRMGVLLCGSMFGLGVARGQLRRHRAFETTFATPQPQCRHRGRAVGVYGHGGHTGKHRMLYRQEAAEALGIDWMSRDQLSQAIPPAYTEYIGKHLMCVLDSLHQKSGGGHAQG